MTQKKCEKRVVMENYLSIYFTLYLIMALSLFHFLIYDSVMDLMLSHLAYKVTVEVSIRPAESDKVILTIQSFVQKINTTPYLVVNSCCLFVWHD